MKWLWSITRSHEHRMQTLVSVTICLDNVLVCISAMTAKHQIFAEKCCDWGAKRLPVSAGNANCDQAVVYGMDQDSCDLAGHSSKSRPMMNIVIAGAAGVAA